MFSVELVILALSFLVTFTTLRKGDSNAFLSVERAASAAGMRDQIETAFLDSWDDYVEHGWGYDVYGPYSHHHKNMPRSGDPMGWIIVDSVDTLMMMYNGTTTHKKEFELAIAKAEEWIENTLTYDIDAEISVFETTIRMLGGLLSAYYLSSEIGIGNPKVYLDKAVDLGDRLALSFATSKSGIPYSSINLHNGTIVKNHDDEGSSSTAEFTTLQMEFKYLSFLTGNDTYWNLAEGVYPPLYKENDLLGDFYQGLVPIFTNPDTGKFHGSNIRMGSRGDSFYEYLLKQYLMTHESLYYELYKGSIDGMKKNLLARSHPNKLLYIGERPYGLKNQFDPKVDHLVCFMGGLMAMGATEGLTIDEARKQPFWNAVREEDWTNAKDFTNTCYQTYHQSPSGLSPEIFVFNEEHPSSKTNSESDRWWQSPSKDYYVKPYDKHNMQRPETVESIMFMYHLSNDDQYREWGAEIFDSFLSVSAITNKTSNTRKFVSIRNVIDKPFEIIDNLESFWLAETLKYLYLLFSDDVDLTSIVFNTEAHPFPVLDAEELKAKQLSTGWSL